MTGVKTGFDGPDGPVEALAHDKRSVPVLIGLLGDHREAVRIAAVRALRRHFNIVLDMLLGKPGPRDQIIHAMIGRVADDPSPQVRSQAMSAMQGYLGRQGHSAVTNACFCLLYDPSQDVGATARSIFALHLTRRMLLRMLAILNDPQEGELARSRVIAVLVEAGSRYGKDVSEAVPALTMALEVDSEGIRSAAADALGEIGGQTAVGALLAALDDPQAEVRAAAVRSLGALADPIAADGLAHLLAKDPQEEVRCEAADALGRLGQRSAVGALIEALKDRGPGVRAKAAEALGALGDPRATGGLFAGLHDKTNNEAVRSWMAIGLAKCGDRRAIPVLLEAFRPGEASAVMLSIIEAMGRSADRRCVAPLLQAIDHYDAWPAALEALGRIGGPVAAAKLRSLAAAGQGDFSAAALRALEVCDGPSAAKLAFDLLRSEDVGYYLTAAATDILARRPTPAAVEPLVACIHREWPDQCSAGAKAMVHIRHPDAVIAIRRIVRPGSASPVRSRRAVIEMLGTYGGDGHIAAPLLIEALPDESDDLFEAAVQALGKLDGPFARRRLEMALDRSEQLCYVFAATRLGWGQPEALAARLISALRRSDYQPRIHALVYMGKLDHASTIPCRAEFLTHTRMAKWQDRVLLVACALSLAASRHEQAIDALRKALHADSPERRRLIAHALSLTDSPQCVPLLIEALDDPDPDVRHDAAMSLGWLYDRRAIEPLVRHVGTCKGGAAEALAEFAGVTLGPDPEKWRRWWRQTATKGAAPP
jgi:HEAT repeat protein